MAKSRLFPCHQLANPITYILSDEKFQEQEISYISSASSLFSGDFTIRHISPDNESPSKYKVQINGYAIRFKNHAHRLLIEQHLRLYTSEGLIWVLSQLRSLPERQIAVESLLASLAAKRNTDLKSIPRTSLRYYEITELKLGAYTVRYFELLNETMPEIARKIEIQLGQQLIIKSQIAFSDLAHLQKFEADLKSGLVTDFKQFINHLNATGEESTGNDKLINQIEMLIAEQKSPSVARP